MGNSISKNDLKSYVAFVTDISCTSARVSQERIVMTSLYLQHRVVLGDKGVPAIRVSREGAFHNDWV
jgi:hypothetical protein